MNNENTSSSAVSFAAWELRLYLNTHPNDERAFAAYKQLCESQGCTYACNVTGIEKKEKASECCQAAPMPTPFNPVPGCHNRMNSGYVRSGCNSPMPIASKATKHPCDRVWHWIDDPWPWEPEANIKGGHF